jgi:hypothetical protein
VNAVPNPAIPSLSGNDIILNNAKGLVT